MCGARRVRCSARLEHLTKRRTLAGQVVEERPWIRDLDINRAAGGGLEGQCLVEAAVRCRRYVNSIITIAPNVSRTMNLWHAVLSHVLQDCRQGRL